MLESNKLLCNSHEGYGGGTSPLYHRDNTSCLAIFSRAFRSFFCNEACYCNSTTAIWHTRCSVTEYHTHIAVFEKQKKLKLVFWTTGFWAVTSAKVFVFLCEGTCSHLSPLSLAVDGSSKAICSASSDRESSTGRALRRDMDSLRLIIFILSIFSVTPPGPSGLRGKKRKEAPSL